jgi:hypothetical protein
MRNKKMPKKKSFLNVNSVNISDKIKILIKQFVDLSIVSSESEFMRVALMEQVYKCLLIKEGIERREAELLERKEIEERINNEVNILKQKKENLKSKTPIINGKKLNVIREA